VATLSTATSNFSNTVVALVNRQVLENLRANVVHLTPDSFIPAEYVKGTNGIFRYVAYVDPSAATVSLTEGSPPTAQDLAINTSEFTAAQKGGVFELTDLATAQSPHDLVAIEAERAGRQAALTADELARQLYSAFATGANISYSNGTARAAVSAVLSGALLKKMVARLGNSNVPRFKDGFYRAIVHPRALYDLMTDTANGGWLDVTRYVDNEPLLRGEVGRYAGVKFLESTIATTFNTAGAGGVDVLRSVFLGRQALAWTGVDSMRSYYVAPGGDHSDPIGQLAKIGWKGYLGGEIIANSGAGPRIQILEHAGTILGSGQA
jgi:N4-gp56 family major capsid protein